MAFGNSRNGIVASHRARVTGNTANDNSSVGITVDDNATAEDNVAFGNNVGLVAGGFFSSATLRNNRAYDNAGAGLVGYVNSLVEGNVSYGNSDGIVGGVNGQQFTGTIAHNVTYDNTAWGIRIDNSASNAEVINNTVYEPTAGGIRLHNSSDNTDLRNNIIQVDAGVAIAVESDSQNGFTSDYNLMFTPGAGTLADWGGIPFDSRADWFYELGLDQHSLAGGEPAFDPQFVDPDGADDMRGFERGAVGAPFIVDDGDAGFSVAGTWSSVSHASGFGGDYFEISTSTGENLATWTFSGLTPGATYEVAATWRPINSNTSAARYRVFDGETPVGWQSFNQRNAPPDFTADGADWGRITTLVVTGDTLEVRLSDDVGGRLLADAIRLQQIGGDHGADDDFHVAFGSPGVDGGDPASSFDMEPAPHGGRRNRGAFGDTSEATNSSAETVHVLSPNGLEKFELGQQVTITWQTDGVPTLPADGVSTEVTIELLDAATLSVVETIAADETLPGTLLWTVPATVPADQPYLIRVTAEEGASMPNDVSDEPFQIVNDGSDYYVNIAGDIDFSDNEFTTAAGDNRNSGKSPESPMASLRALIAAYDLDPGDVVHVDTGAYTLVANVEIAAEDASVSILGAQQPGHTTLLDRNNRVDGSYAFLLLDADGVTLDGLSVTGGSRGIYAPDGSDSDGVTIRNSRVFGNALEEIWLDETNDDPVVTASEVFDPTSSSSDGVRIDGLRATVTDNRVYGHRDGILVFGIGAAIERNETFDNTSQGIFLNISNDSGSTVIDNVAYANAEGIRADVDGTSVFADVSGNIAFGNSDHGIVAFDDVLVSHNTTHGNLDIGILIDDNAVAAQNVAYGNQTGIVAGGFFSSATARDNRVYDNEVGIVGYVGSLVTGNVSYSNQTGIAGLANGQDFSGTIRNNRTYDNAVRGILVDNATGGVVENNTIVEAVGDAVVVRGGTAQLDVRNNILWVEGGVGVSVAADSQNGFTSDFNWIYSPAAGRLGDWGGLPFDTQADWYHELGLGRQTHAGDTPAFDPLLVDPDGADGIAGYSHTPVGAAVIIDDGDAGFSVTSGWTPVSHASSFDGDYQEISTSSSTGADVAVWTFSGLTPGATYELATTWRAVSGNVGEARYRVFDADVAVGWREVNQRVAPDDFTDAGSSWERIVTLAATTDTITVRLSDDNAGRLLADAVRLQQIEGDHGADDDFHLQAGSPAIDEGDLASDAANEPTPNGDRNNLGAYGNTVEATTSAAQVLQVTSPNGHEKFEVGQEVRIQWHQAGLPAIATDAAYDLTVNEQQPLAFYGVDEAAGAVTAVDRTGSHDGAYQGDPTLVAEGAFGLADNAAVALDGVDDFIEVPHHPDFDLRHQVSFSFWLNVDSFTDTWSPLIYKGGSSSSDRTYSMWLNDDGYLYLSTFDTSNRTVQTPDDSIQPGQWYHVAGVIDREAGEMRIYIDGRQRASSTSISRDVDAVSSSQPLRIGWTTESSSSFEPLQGRIDEVAIFDYPLSAQDVAAQFARKAANVTIELLDAGTQTVVETIAADAPLPGSLRWTVPATVTADQDYLLRVTSGAAGGSPSDVSDTPFQIVNDGNLYYVNVPNDADLTDNEYTMAAGDNAHTGKSPDAPMASLRALLQAYDLDAGDVVMVDTGAYTLPHNVELRLDDSGVRLLGAQQPGHETLLDRANTVDGSYVVELLGGDDVTVEAFGLTGGFRGVFGGDRRSHDVTFRDNRIFDSVAEQVFVQAFNDRLTLDGNEIFDSINTSHDGVNIDADDATLTGNRVHDNNDGIQVTGLRSRIIGNEVFDNADRGIRISVSRDGGTTVAGNTVSGNAFGISVSTSGTSVPVEVRGNEVFDNSTDGISVANHVIVSSNTVHDNTRYGIGADDDALVVGNVSFGNQYGIVLGGFFSSAVARNNRVYNNSNTGIFAWRASVVDGNIAYSNSVGIRGEENGTDFIGDIFNNVLYANTNQGILITNAADGARAVNNTIFQDVGDAVRVEQNSTNVRLRNNIVWVNSGHDVFVAANSQAGFDSDYNLFHQGVDPNAFVGFWGGTTADLLGDWQTLTGQDASSVAGDPLFIDVDGADNVLGYDAAGDGFDGGSDDNFILRKNSPAIDRAESWSAPSTDRQGSPRLDDPGIVNQGGPEYVQTTVTNDVFDGTPGGVAQDWRGFNNIWTYNLPFTFSFYGVDYTSVFVSANGLLQFGSDTSATDGTNTTSELLSQIRIAALWDNLRTNFAADDDVSIDESQAGRAVIRWNATNEADNSDVNFAVALFDDGTIQFHYGSGNTNLTPTVGISAGDSFNYQLPVYDGQTVLTDVTSLQFALAPGIVDIGAYEFRGDSQDATPPTVIGSIPSLVHDQGVTLDAVDTIELQFSEEINNIDANALAAYDLRNSGPNGIFGDGEDTVFTAVPNFQLGDSEVTLSVLEGDLPPGEYRFTAFSRAGRSNHDTAGLRLDGDNDGVEGGDYERFFTIAANQAPNADDQNLTTFENTPLEITLTGDDGDPDFDQQIAYVLTSLLVAGTLSTTSGGPAIKSADLPLVLPTPTLFFTPAVDSINSQTFQFVVRDDGGTANGGQDESPPATISIDIIPAPRVTLSVDHAAIDETGGVATVTVSLSRVATDPVIVDLAVGGDVTAADYALTATSLMIPAGATSATATLTATDDLLDEDDETVVIDIESVTGGVEDGEQTATVMILDDDAPLLSVAATDPTAAEPGDDGRFTVFLTNPTSADTTISYSIAGTATADGDYIALTGSVTIMAGQTSATIDVIVIDDLAMEADETVSLTLTEALGLGDRIAIDPAAASATVVIADDGDVQRTSTVIDNDDATGYSDSGDLSYWFAQGFLGDLRQVSGPAQFATYTFDGLVAGQPYEVSATWTPHGFRSPAAPVTVTGGESGPRTIGVNQRLAPNDFFEFNAGWERIGTFRVDAAGRLTVRIAGAASGTVVADAVRVDLVSRPEIAVSHNGADLSSGAAVDFGSWLTRSTVRETFSVENVGSETLVLAATLALPAGYQLVGTAPLTAFGGAATSLAPGASLSFELELDTLTAGLRSGVLAIGSNDADENPFTISLTGQATGRQIVDNDDSSGYADTGNLSYWFGQGFQNDLRQIDAVGRSATFTFNGVVPGRAYQLAATWPAYPTRSIAAPLTVRGAQGGDQTVTVNQRLAPDDFPDAGVFWESIGTFWGGLDGTLTIEIGGAVGGNVVADAVRIEHVDRPEIEVLHESLELLDGATVDFSSLLIAADGRETFTVRNVGSEPLTLDPTLLVPTGFSLVGATPPVLFTGAPTAVASGEAVSFELQMDTDTLGPRSGALAIGSSDADENPLTIMLTGSVVAARIVDNDNPPGYSHSGNPRYWQGQGFQNDVRELLATSQSATYTFTGLVPGRAYEVAATWTQYPNRSTAAPYTIAGIAGGPQTISLNQRLAPDDFSASGAAWERLGAFLSDVSGTLTVQIAGAPDGAVIADAVRIEDITPPMLLLPPPVAPSAFGHSSTLVLRSNPANSPSTLGVESSVEDKSADLDDSLQTQLAIDAIHRRRQRAREDFEPLDEQRRDELASLDDWFALLAGEETSTRSTYQ